MKKKQTDYKNLSLIIWLVAVVVASAAVVVVVVAAVEAVVVAAVVAVVVAAVAADKDYKLSFRISCFSLLCSAISFILTFGVSINYSSLFNWYILLLSLILMEVYFWLIDKKTPEKNENKLFFAFKRKFVGYSYSLATIFLSFTIYQFTIKIKDYWQTILKWIGYIGVGIIGLAIVIGIVCLFLKLNSLKYK